MKRYLKLYWSFFKNCLIREMEFRSHFFLINFISLSWAICFLLVYFFIYQHVDSVQGWTLEQVLLLTAIYFFIDRIFDSFFEINFDNFINLVNQGDLDLVLTKPVSSQFIVSLRHFSFSMVFSNIAMIGVIVYLCRLYFWPLSGWVIINFLMLIICAIVITYSLWFITLLPVFWWGRARNLNEFFRPIHQLGRVPIDVTGKLKPFLTYVIPLAFISTIPAQALIGRLSIHLVFYGVFVAGFLLWLSHRLWRFSLKHYTSASS